MTQRPDRYDAIVIGTGFGGSVTAARLAQAGARVLVLERGMRYSGDTFPALPRDGQAIADPARFVWSSEEGRLGLWDVRDLGATHAASAAGYGGGSLIYANVHLRAPQEVFEGWPKPYSRAALDPYYDLAAHMLEVDTIESAAPSTRSPSRVKRVPSHCKSGAPCSDARSSDSTRRRSRSAGASVLFTMRHPSRDVSIAR